MRDRLRRMVARRPASEDSRAEVSKRLQEAQSLVPIWHAESFLRNTSSRWQSLLLTT
jgi:hypothetical protein